MKFSNIGFGSYRIDNRIEEHYKALYKSLTSGINLIDTSANYADGESEILIGRVTGDLISENVLKRDDIFLVTKAGYIQGKNYKTAIKLKEEGKLFSEVTEVQDRLWHCISPDFLEDQLTRQLQRLNSDYIDSYLLHNPEYFLEKVQEENTDLSEAREIYYGRIRKSFEFLEEKVSEGKIRSYGISSNTFPVYSDSYSFTSLEKVIDAANSVSANNNFKMIQMPFNLFEAGAVTIKNQINNTETVLELADKSNISVIVNRPLNAITSKGLVRLAEFRSDAFHEKDFIKQMKLVSLMEEDLITEKIPAEELKEEDVNKILKHLSFGKQTEENWKYFGSIEHYNDVITQLFAPKIDFMIRFFDENITDENTKEFFGRYIKECYKMLNFVSSYYKMRAEKRSQFINSVINKDLDAKFKELTLSQKAILLLNSVKGVSCVLAGIRKEKYADDVLKILNKNDIPNADKIIRRVSEEIINADT